MAWDFAAELNRYGPAFTAAGRAPSLAAARRYCAAVARSHYENFTVASALLPRPLVPHFHAVYAYCRWADDLADETPAGAAALSLLRWWRGEFLNPASPHPVLVAVRDTARKFAIPPAPFLALLTAFEQDQRVRRYETFADLLGYCRNSADPVGRLVLHLFNCAGDGQVALADGVCTGLQLANFWQDVARDAARGRVYLPQEDLRRFGVADADLAAGRFTPAFADLMRFEVDRTRGYFARGRGLLPLLPARARLDVELFLAGGGAVLDAIERRGYDVLTARPVVGKAAKLGLLLRAWLGGLFA